MTKKRNGLVLFFFAVLSAAPLTGVAKAHDDHVHAAVVTQAAVVPVLECVRSSDGETFAAVFGYDNTTGRVVRIEVPGNMLSPGIPERGQPLTFLPGRHVDSFRASFDDSALSWTITGADGIARTTTASPSSRPCAAQGGVARAAPAAAAPLAGGLVGGGYLLVGVVRRFRARATDAPC